MGECKRAFKISYDTWFRVSPTIPPQPLTINGQNYLGILCFPGGGTGQATHLGNSMMVFKQLAYIQSPRQAILGSVAASLTQAPSYPAAGAFSEFIPYLFSLAIPEKLGDHSINSVLYNDKGDAFF